MRIRRLLCSGGVLLALVVGAAACDRNESVDSLSATYGLPSNEVDIQAEEWLLVPSESSIDVGPIRDITLSVDDDRVFGQAPCNSYRGTIEIDGDEVSITKLATTLKACDDAVMRAEQRYLEALGSVNTVDVSDEELELTNGQRLTYEPR